MCPQFIFYRILQHAFVRLNGKHNLNAIIRTSFRHMASGRTSDSLRSRPPRGSSVLLARKSHGRARRVLGREYVFGSARVRSGVCGGGYLMAI